VQLEKEQTLEIAVTRERRKRRVNAIISDGLSNLPSHAIQLNSLLSSPAVDLGEASEIIRSEPNLYIQVLSLANSALGSLRQPVLAISEAVVLLGAERVRTLVLSYAFVKVAGRQLSDQSIQEFWQHSSLTATFSERIARRLGSPEPEEAYVAGLLHDIGRLPLLIVAQEEKAKGDAPPPKWRDNRSFEREFFGMDHCEAGRSISAAWNFAPILVDAIGHHHAPLNAKVDASLVGIVAAGDYYAGLPSATTAEYQSDGLPLPAADASAFLRICLPGLRVDDWVALENPAE
jgi:putative nucleotidyltransferase with HDIG domain